MIFSKLKEKSGFNLYLVMSFIKYLYSLLFVEIDPQPVAVTRISSSVPKVSVLKHAGKIIRESKRSVAFRRINAIS